MTNNQFSLFEKLPSTIPIAFWNGRYIKREEFSIANSLPEHQYSINLCEDRYMFLVTFVACMLRGQTSLLPPNRAKNEVKYLHRTYPDSYRIVDCPTVSDDSNEYFAQVEETGTSGWTKNEFNNELIAAIVFTSGSTGNPKPNPKRWSDLVSSALKIKQQLKLGESGNDSIVATVPPQHMFGFEMSIIYPMVNGACIHCDKPFFPRDIKEALDDMPAPRVLVTTPIHLRGCGESNLDWPAIDSVVSATSPLPNGVAYQAEEQMQAMVKEIYGCSEVGAIATRESARDKFWNLLEGYHLRARMNRFLLHVPGLIEEIELPDHIKIIGENKFTLVGRHSDLVNIGGKRGSLADLSIKLKSLKGVKDGVFFVPDTEEGKRVRLAALVVAPDRTEEEIIAQLTDNIDRIFLPRPIIKVDRLPYNETGKLPKKAILSVFYRTRHARLLLETA